MRPEQYRQLVHFGGFLFIILAQLIDKHAMALYFILLSVFFLAYSEYAGRGARTLGPLSRIEKKIRDVALMLERGTKRPFMGAFWFYLSLGAVFLLFPLHIASAAGAMLAIGDALSTAIGIRFGKRRISGKKTLEGSSAFFAGSFFAGALFVGYTLAAFAAAFATFIELLPSARPLKRLAEKQIVDDNWMIPVFTATFMALLYYAA